MAEMIGLITSLMTDFLLLTSAYWGDGEKRYYPALLMGIDGD